MFRRLPELHCMPPHCTALPSAPLQADASSSSSRRGGSGGKPVAVPGDSASTGMHELQLQAQGDAAQRRRRQQQQHSSSSTLSLLRSDSSSGSATSNPESSAPQQQQQQQQQRVEMAQAMADTYGDAVTVFASQALILMGAMLLLLAAAAAAAASRPPPSPPPLPPLLPSPAALPVVEREVVTQAHNGGNQAGGGVGGAEGNSWSAHHGSSLVSLAHSLATGHALLQQVSGNDSKCRCVSCDGGRVTTPALLRRFELYLHASLVFLCRFFSLSPGVHLAGCSSRLLRYPPLPLSPPLVLHLPRRLLHLIRCLSAFSPNRLLAPLCPHCLCLPAPPHRVPVWRRRCAVPLCLLPRPPRRPLPLLRGPHRPHRRLPRPHGPQAHQLPRRTRRLGTRPVLLRPLALVPHPRHPPHSLPPSLPLSLVECV